MEKQRIWSEFKCCRRFLIYSTALLICLFSSSNLFAARLRYSVIKTLEVLPAEDVNYTASDVLFTLTLPYVSSNEIQIDQPENLDGIRFKSVRKSQFYTGEGGVNVDMWVNFEEPGDYILPALSVRIYGYAYKIPFRRVHIDENMQKILPRMIFQFEDGREIIFTRGKIFQKPLIIGEQGTTMTFDVYLQHAVQIVSFNTFVPKNGIFSELKRYDISKVNPKGTEYSTEYVPVGRFSWTPLASGQQLLPMIQIMATAYNGDRIELKTPELMVQVHKNDVELKKLSVNEKKYDYAFVELSEKDESSQRITVTREDCQRLAFLRTAERHGSPFSSEKKSRINFEKNIGILDSQNEPLYFDLILSLSITLVFMILAIVFIIFKKMWLSIGAMILFITFMIFAILCGIQLNSSSAVIYNGKIRNVPEDSVEAIQAIDSGSRVKILQKAGSWSFVQFGTTSGWITDDDMIMITD